jgi:ATP-dependent Clp protease, protease subunit
VGLENKEHKREGEKMKQKELEVGYVYDYNIDTVSRTIFFMPWNAAGDIGSNYARDPWEVDDWSASSLIKGLHILEMLNHKPITVKWLSYGGDWDAGMGIFDYIKTMKSKVNLHAYGRIRSMGTILLQACNKRILSENCLFLIHYGYAWCESSQKDFEAFAENLKKDNTTTEDIYLEQIHKKHPKFTREKLQDLMKYDKYMTAKEAVDLGLADGLIK